MLRPAFGDPCPVRFLMHAVIGGLGYADARETNWKPLFSVLEDFIVELGRTIDRKGVPNRGFLMNFIEILEKLYGFYCFFIGKINTFLFKAAFFALFSRSGSVRKNCASGSFSMFSI